MYRYETHLHTAPVSKCARVCVRDVLTFYRSLEYDGVFITNHFLDGNINVDVTLPYEERIAFYFSDYEEGVKIGKELGIKVFCGVELSYRGTDFLVYGLDKEWFLRHPEIMEMKKSEELRLMMDAGALVIQAHPYREASYIDHIRLFPRSVHGTEVLNAQGTQAEIPLAEQYARSYGLLRFAGSDNHRGSGVQRLAGMQFESPILDETDFVRRILTGDGEIFELCNPLLKGELL